MYQEIKEKLINLDQQLNNPVIIANGQQYSRLAKERSETAELVNLINQLETTKQQLAETQHLFDNDQDPEIQQMAEAEQAQLLIKLANFQQQIDQVINQSDPRDQKNVIMEIRAGAGGNEAALFVAEIFRMYYRFTENHNFKLEILNSSPIDIGGYKEITFTIVGQRVFGSLKYESGTHRVQRVPETEKQGRVHTSTVTVAVLPEAEEVDIEIKPSDLRIDTYCSSGPGGQSVNTTYSAIRIIHEPTGLVVTCQDQKSQHQNKEKALQILRSRLWQKIEDEQQAATDSQRRQQIGSGDRSEKIRTYNFPQDRVTDHRLQKSWHSIDRIMDGEIDEIIQDLQQHAQQLAQNN